MARVTVLPNFITAIGLTCGLFVIFKMNMTPIGEANLHVLTIASVILLLAAFADFIDGAVARILRAESSFGGYFDSLADGINFGVAPSVIVLKSLSLQPGTPYSYLVTGAAMIYTISGVLRLVRFNIIKENPELVESAKKHFTGLPIPAAAACIVSLNLFLVSNEFQSMIEISETARLWVLFVAMVAIGYFMISRWKFFSLKTLHLKVSSFRMVFLTVIFAIMLFWGILNHFPVVFFAIAWGYVILAWILSLLRIIAGRRNKALEEFEPEPDDELE